jgi:hypothetical protein
MILSVQGALLKEFYPANKKISRIVLPLFEVESNILHFISNLISRLLLPLFNCFYLPLKH